MCYACLNPYMLEPSVGQINIHHHHHHRNSDLLSRMRRRDGATGMMQPSAGVEPHAARCLPQIARAGSAGNLLVRPGLAIMTIMGTAQLHTAVQLPGTASAPSPQAAPAPPAAPSLLPCLCLRRVAVLPACRLFGCGQEMALKRCSALSALPACHLFGCGRPHLVVRVVERVWAGHCRALDVGPLRVVKVNLCIHDGQPVWSTATVRIGSDSRSSDSRLAPDETVILLHPPLPLVSVSIVMERERQQHDSLVNGHSRRRIFLRSANFQARRASSSPRYRRCSTPERCRICPRRQGAAQRDASGTEEMACPGQGGQGGSSLQSGSLGLTPAGASHGTSARAGHGAGAAGEHTRLRVQCGAPSVCRKMRRPADKDTGKRKRGDKGHGERPGDKGHQGIRRGGGRRTRGRSGGSGAARSRRPTFRWRGLLQVVKQGQHERDDATLSALRTRHLFGCGSLQDVKQSTRVGNDTHRTEVVGAGSGGR